MGCIRTDRRSAGPAILGCMRCAGQTTPRSAGLIAAVLAGVLVLGGPAPAAAPASRAELRALADAILMGPLAGDDCEFRILWLNVKPGVVSTVGVLPQGAGCDAALAGINAGMRGEGVRFMRLPSPEEIDARRRRTQWSPAEGRRPPVRDPAPGVPDPIPGRPAIRPGPDDLTLIHEIIE